MALAYELVTPEKLVREGSAYMVTVPGIEGDVGVLENHAPFMTVLRDGPLKIYATDGAVPEEVQVSGGFAEVSARGLTVLAEAASAT